MTDTENVLGELAPTYDADGGDDELSEVTIDGVTDNLLQDFGYAPPGQEPGEGLIGDTVWLDRDGDSAYDPGEGTGRRARHADRTRRRRHPGHRR